MRPPPVADSSMRLFLARIGPFAAAAIALLVQTSPALAQVAPDGRVIPPGGLDPVSIARPTLAVFQTDDELTLDGRLDEAVWSRADSTEGPFWLAIPRQGVPQELHTVVRILQRGDELWIGAILYEADPSVIVSSGLEQDFEVEASDMFGVALDTYLDRRNGYFWSLNPAGSLYDTQIWNDGRQSEVAWEGVVGARTARRPDGWSAEMRIPFSTLRYRPSDQPQTWGLNLFRRSKARNEDANWAAVHRQFRPYRFSLAGSLTGIRAGTVSRNLSVKPYVLATNRSGSLTDHARRGDAGVDAKWGITPRLTLDATINTDFSQVEVDQEQVNLSRFSLFFPEKRDFFLENDGLFTFQDQRSQFIRSGSGPQDFRLFHSRRIGLSDDRRPVPILAGARLTGRAAGFELGMLEMQTRESTLGPAENFAVSRIRYGVKPGLTVGGLFANRQVTSGEGRPWNRSYGLDLNWSPNAKLTVNAYGARTDFTGASGDRNIGMLQVSYRTVWDIGFLLKHTGDAFRPGTGFVSRTDARRLFFTVGAHPQPAIPGVIELNPYMDFDWTTNLEGMLETRQLTPGFAVTFKNESILTVERANHFERLFESLPISGDRVPPGTYEFGETVVTFKSNQGLPLHGTVTFRHGDFFNGRRTGLGGTAVWRANPHFALTAGFDRNELELDGRDVPANVFSLKAQVARDTRTFLLGFVQYNEVTDEIVTNLRFNLVHAPLSDLFVVFTERRAAAHRIPSDPTRPDSAVHERGITLKVTRLLGL